MFQYFTIMDSQSIFDIWKELATLTVNSIKEIDKGLEVSIN